MKYQIFIYIIFLTIKTLNSTSLIDNIYIENSLIKKFNVKSNLTYEISNLNISQNLTNWISTKKKIGKKIEYINFF